MTIEAGLTKFQALFRGKRCRETHVERVRQGLPWSPFVPAKDEAIRQMIEIAQILPHETIVDIGSGDGRVLIGAASSVCLKKAIGIEIDSTLVALSRRKIIESNLQDKIEIIHKDWLDVSLEKVDVVILFFLPHEKIASILTEKLLPGTRIVTYVFQISQWKPEKIIETVPFMTSKGNSTIYLYRAPELKTA